MRSANATVPRTAHAVCKHHSATHRSCGLQTSQCHAPLMRSANITVPRTAHAVCKHHSATHRSCGLQTSQCHAPLMRSANVTVPRTARAVCKCHSATHRSCGAQAPQCHALSMWCLRGNKRKNMPLSRKYHMGISYRRIRLREILLMVLQTSCGIGR